VIVKIHIIVKVAVLFDKHRYNELLNNCQSNKITKRINPMQSNFS